MGLKAYREKRRFGVTPEPSGRRAGQRGGRLRFVVQKHAARRLHWDFRLELDGVLKSWAVPKGPSTTPGERRLAVEVEDHPLEYASFHGRIPAGQYGAGTVEIWDEGGWEPIGDPRAGLRRGSLGFTLSGHRLQGRWTLVRMESRSGRPARTPQWLLVKSREDPGEAKGLERTAGVRQKPRRAAAALPGKPGALPRFLPPQLATLVAQVPDDDDWLHEIKFDGYRLQARLDRGGVTLRTRKGLDWTDRFRPVAEAVADLPVTRALIDGEVAVLGSDGVTHFQLLQNAIGSSLARGLAFFVFDLLHVDGRDLTRVPLEERKRVLENLVPRGSGIVRYSDHVLGHGARFHGAACERGLEGIISKRRTALYVGGRSRDWLKGKCRPRQEFVIGGWTDPAGSREAFGSLLLGAHDASGRLVYVGRVGTGFKAATLARLGERFARLARSRPPFVNPPRQRDTHWVEPRLVAEVSFATWTHDRQLRQAAFEGLREDKPARDVKLDLPATPPDGRASNRRPRSEKKPATSRDQAAAGDSVAGVTITHPERPIWRPEKITKLDLARYVEAVAPLMLPHVAGRPLMVMHCRNGVDAPGEPCFVQKHPRLGGGRESRARRDPSDASQHLAVGDVEGLVRLIQNGAVEIHGWGATLAAIERPDRIVFDLDPHESVPWPRVVAAARELRLLLGAWKLPAYLKTTGGKGLHVLVPLQRRHGWPEVRAAAEAIAAEMARQSPGDLVLEMSKAKRAGRILIDVMRNVRGATSVAPYSPRARPGAPISMPLTWSQLTAHADPRRYTVAAWPRVRPRRDPWQGWEKDRARLPVDLTRRKALAR